MLLSYIPSITVPHIKQDTNLKRIPDTQVFIKTEIMVLFKYALFHCWGFNKLKI